MGRGRPNPEQRLLPRVQGTQASPTVAPQSGLPPLSAPSKAVGRRPHTLHPGSASLQSSRSWQPSLP